MIIQWACSFLLLALGWLLTLTGAVLRGAGASDWVSAAAFGLGMAALLAAWMIRP